jgi:hypothetical protein
MDEERDDDDDELGLILEFVRFLAWAVMDD